MTNRVKLEQLGNMTTAEVANLPVDQLAALQEDYAEATKYHKAIGARINDALALRYSDKAAARRGAQGKDTGTVTLDDGEFRVTADLPKKVTWDADKLQAVVAMIRGEWNEDPEDYVSFDIKVSEAKYAAWPPSLKELFTPARTVGTGAATYKLAKGK